MQKKRKQERKMGKTIVKQKNDKCKALLAIYDVSGIQDYIFATNHLKENIGASLIVTEALNECLPKALQDMRKDSLEENEDGEVIINWKEQESFSLQMTKDSNVIAEIIYVGGGNALVLYKDEEKYNDASRKLAKRFFEKTRYLTVITAAVKTDFSDFHADKESLNRKLEQVKGKTIRQEPLSLFPIAEQEPIYGYPVNETRNGEYLSFVQVEKQEEYNKIKNFASFPLQKNIIWAKEMEELITKKGQDSYVAVVHIDGNGMGDMIGNYMRTIEKNYSSAIPKMRELSIRLSKIFNGIYEQIIDYFQNEPKYLKDLEVDNVQKKVLPIRHVIMDGDDVTFICNAKLAIPIVAIFLKLLMKEQQEQNLSACAGIAFVHSHYPFRIAYQIAESCCANAKKQWYREQENGSSGKKGYFDFQLIRGAGQTELDLIREENFTCPKKAITRPYYVALENEPKEDIYSFDFLNQLMGKLPEEFTENRKIGSKEWSRNRLKKLYEAYLQGGGEVELLKLEYASRGYDFSTFSESKEFSLFDGLELIDMYDRNLYQNFFEFYKKKRRK